MVRNSDADLTPPYSCLGLEVNRELPTNKEDSIQPSTHDQFTLQSTLFVAMAMAANVLAFLYQLAMARLLEPRQFAAVLAIVSAMAIVVFPANAFQAAVANGSVRMSAEGKSDQLGAFAAHAAIGGGIPLAAIAAVTFLFREAVGQFFGFDGTAVALWICASLIMSMWLAAHRGVLQGSGDFTALGIVVLAEVSIRLLVSIALVVGGFGVDGATAGFPLGIGGALALGVWMLRQRFGGSSGIRDNLWSALAHESRAVPAMLAVYGVQAIDIVVANTRLHDADLQAFSAATLAGRIVFYAGFVITLLILPRYRSMFIRRRLEKRMVAGSFGTITAICTGGVVAGLSSPELLHTVLVGSSYSMDTQLMQTYILGSTLLTYALFLISIVVAAGWTRIALVVCPIALGQTAIYAFGVSTGLGFAQVLATSAGAMALVLMIAVAILLRTTAWRAHDSAP